MNVLAAPDGALAGIHDHGDYEARMMTSCMCTGECRNGGKCPADKLPEFKASGTATITMVNAGKAKPLPELPKGKKARIAALEARVAQLEAELARRPLVTYTQGKPWWYSPPGPAICMTSEAIYP